MGQVEGGTKVNESGTVPSCGGSERKVHRSRLYIRRTRAIGNNRKGGIGERGRVFVKSQRTEGPFSVAMKANSVLKRKI